MQLRCLGERCLRQVGLPKGLHLPRSQVSRYSGCRWFRINGEIVYWLLADILLHAQSGMDDFRVEDCAMTDNIKRRAISLRYLRPISKIPPMSSLHGQFIVIA